MLSVGKQLRDRELLGRILVTAAETSLEEGSRESCWSLRECGFVVIGGVSESYPGHVLTACMPVHGGAH